MFRPRFLIVLGLTLLVFLAGCTPQWVQQLNTSCAGPGDACRDAAAAVLKQNPRSALRWGEHPALAQKVCDSGQCQVCRALGDAYARTDGPLEPNPERALGLYQKACSADCPESCLTPAILLSKGDVGVEPWGALLQRYGAFGTIKKDLPRAIAALERACQAGHKKASGQACLTLGMMSEKGTHGRPKSEEKAMAYFLRGCALGHPTSCVKAGDMHPIQLGACFLYATPCHQQQDAFACQRIGQMCKELNMDAAALVASTHAQVEQMRARLKAALGEQAEQPKTEPPKAEQPQSTPAAGQSATEQPPTSATTPAAAGQSATPPSSATP